MSVDGFQPEHAQPFVGFTPATARRFYGALGRLARRLNVQVEGLEHLPRGRALLGTREKLDRLLEHDELVLVQPGGLREALKPRELRYRLLWGKRHGFVRAAIANQAPVLPLAAVGGDELFSLLGNAYERGQRWLRRGIPVPLPSRILPIPHFVPWRFVLGEPIPPRFPWDQADNPAAQHQLRHEVEGALHELLETELARRAGIDLR